MLVAVYPGLAGMLRPPLKFSGDGLGVVAALTLICWQGENSLLKNLYFDFLSVSSVR